MTELQDWCIETGMKHRFGAICSLAPELIHGLVHSVFSPLPPPDTASKWTPAEGGRALTRKSAVGPVSKPPNCQAEGLCPSQFMQDCSL